MIVEALYDVLFGFLDLVFSAFTLPGFSDGVLQVFNTIKGYLIVGMEILLVFTQKDILYFCLGSALFGIVVYEIVSLVFLVIEESPCLWYKLIPRSAERLAAAVLSIQASQCLEHFNIRRRNSNIINLRPLLDLYRSRVEISPHFYYIRSAPINSQRFIRWLFFCSFCCSCAAAYSLPAWRCITTHIVYLHACKEK